MLRPVLTALLLTATPALAFDIEAMTDAEREAFRAEIRAYLLENPEVLMEAIGVLEERRAEASAAEEGVMLETHRAAIFEDGYSWVGGNPDGDVTMVEFLDYRCGFCKRAHPHVNQLLEMDGNIRYIVKEFPILGEQSVLASRYAISVLQIAGDEAYGKVHDALMTWNGDITEGALARIGREAGIDHDAVVAHMNTDAVTKIIDQNHALAAELKIQGTPSFVMGDKFVRGYVELDQMLEIVDGIRDARG
jgi:protein-disulfide isomerase